ncbi:MAG: sulfotransferase domain-containing protein [Phycisphaerae bacterium]|jgi:hypothetical protein|nr:sulfotransferase domain-containing protein [Phycisphaerae bacterium]
MPTIVHRTECVSFPRSGHHLLEGLLLRYFGEQGMRYCEQYAHPERRLDLDPETRFQKNHDFDLDTPIRSDRQYIVQIRYPLDSLVSLFKLNVKQSGLPDTPAAWTNFAINKIGYWMRFYKKWVLDHVDRRLVVNYADLVDEPVAMLTQVVCFLGETEPDMDRIREACAAESIHVRNDYKCFNHYGAQFFTLLKGYFCAVPGVDVEADRLLIPQQQPTESGRLAREMRDTAEALRRLAFQVDHQFPQPSGHNENGWRDASWAALASLSDSTRR